MEADDPKAFSRTICAICFEELKPVVEDLQSVSICGHVFHELCLQQWFEYCPSGKKNTCPVCKQSCSQKTVHRLYFQSLGECTQPLEKPTVSVSPSDNVAALRVELGKLGGQLGVVNRAFGEQQQRLKELTVELSSVKDRAANEEALKVAAVREKDSLQQLLKRKTEELTRSVEECSKLHERSLALAQELAAHKLLSNLDLGEDDITKLASVGHAANSEAVIDTLRRSLILRNKSYKELMTQCNLLGREAQVAQKELAKSVKRTEKLKERLKELEVSVEHRDNEALRAIKLKASKRLCAKGVGDYSRKPSFDDSNENFKLNMDGELIGGSSNFCAGFLKNQSLDKNTSFETHNNRIASELSALETEVINVDMEEADFQTDMLTRKFRNPETNAKLCMKGSIQFPAVCSNSFHHNHEEIIVDEGCRPVKSLGSHLAGGANHGRPDNSEDTPLLFSSGDDDFISVVKEKATLHSNSVVHSDQQCLPSGLLGSKLTGKPMGKWCKQGLPASKDPSNTGQLIAVGADGKGGTIKVLRNPNHPFGSQVGKQQNLYTKPSRRLAEGTKQNVHAQGCLQIEHFFSKPEN